MDEQKGETPMLTTRQIADRLNVNHRTVEDWIKSGRLKAVNIGTTNRQLFRIDADYFERWIKRGGFAW